MYTYISLVIEICHAMNALHLKVKLEEIVADVGGCYINVSLSERAVFLWKEDFNVSGTIILVLLAHLSMHTESVGKKMYTKVTL